MAWDTRPARPGSPSVEELLASIAVRGGHGAGGGHGGGDAAFGDEGYPSPFVAPPPPRRGHSAPVLPTGAPAHSAGPSAPQLPYWAQVHLLLEQQQIGSSGGGGAAAGAAGSWWGAAAADAPPSATPVWPASEPTQFHYVPPALRPPEPEDGGGWALSGARTWAAVRDSLESIGDAAYVARTGIRICRIAIKWGMHSSMVRVM